MKFLKPRSEEEARAWLAINSIDAKIFKQFLKFLPILTIVFIAVVVIMGVIFLIDDNPMTFWNWFVFLVACALCVILTFMSIWIRRKGVDFFFRNDAQDPLDLLSNKERRDYRVLSWLAALVPALFLVLVTVAVNLHFRGVMEFATPEWVLLGAGGFVLSICVLYWTYQRSLRLVKKMATKLAEEHAPTPAKDS